MDDPVEILVKMAERGEIDPWNIDITEVTDRFFAEMEKQEILDLRLSARTLLYAATLLRIKSDYLKDPGWGSDEEEDLGIPVDDGSGDAGDSHSFHDPVSMLEHEIKRRLLRKNMRKQPITLYDLINLLRNAEKEERRRQREVWSFDGLLYTTEDVVSIAHEEAYQENAMHVLTCCADCTVLGGKVTLSEVAKRLTWPPVHVYIPLLFLMHEGYLELTQETFFGEVYIEPHSAMFAAISSSHGVSTN